MWQMNTNEAEPQLDMKLMRGSQSEHDQRQKRIASK